MPWAILIILASVGAGTLLALLPRASRRLLGPVRTFGFASALGVVALHLLPEALREMGPWALLALPLGLAAPEALGRSGAWFWKLSRPGREAPPDLALEASYVGLLFHRVGDGIGLGVYTGELAHGHAAVGAVAALAAHAVPVVAIVVLTFDSLRGRRTAVGRAIGLGFASIVGVLLTQSVLAETVVHASGFFSAFVSGMLLHVVSHDLHLELPDTWPEKITDVVVGAAGLLVSLIGVGFHSHGSEADSPQALVEALGQVGREVIPPLALGAALLLGICWLVDRFGPRPAPAWLVSTGLAAETGPVSWFALGGMVTGVRLLAAGVLLSFRGVRGQGAAEESCGHQAAAAAMGRQPLARVVVARLEQDLAHLLLALLVAANLSVALPGAWLGGVSWPLQTALVVGFSLLVRAPGMAALVVGLALSRKGLSPAALLPLLVVGPCLRAGAWELKAPGARVTLLAVVLLPVTLGVGLQLLSGPQVSPEAGGLLGTPLLALGVLLIGGSVARRGLRGVFSSHVHAHVHAHD